MSCAGLAVVVDDVADWSEGTFEIHGASALSLNCEYLILAHWRVLVLEILVVVEALLEGIVSLGEHLTPVHAHLVHGGVLGQQFRRPDNARLGVVLRAHGVTDLRTDRANQDDYKVEGI